MTHEPFVDLKRAAEFLSKDRRWLYQNQERLKVPRYRLGSQYRYRLSELADWLERSA